MYNNPGGQSSPSQGIRFTFLTQSDQSKFEQIFSQTAAQFGGNKISAQAVSELLRRSNLDNDSLAKIWDLASIANAPHLTFPEFAVAMWLTSKKLTGQTLPASLPPNIREETEIAMATIASTETPQPQQQVVNTSIPQYNTPMMTGMPQQQQPMMTGMPPLQQNMMTGMPPQQHNMMTGMVPQQTGMVPQQFNPQLPMQTGFRNMAPIQTAMQTGYIRPQTSKVRLQNLDFAKKMMPNQSGVTNLLNPSLGTSDANRISWKISPEDKQRYRDIFNAWEGSGSGFMSGDTAKDVLTQSQLPPADLMKIWNLADAENKGSLDVDEFAVAMHLVYRKMNGFEIPAVLPSELKPPSSVLKKFILGRRPPPSKPSFSPQPQVEEEESDDDSYGQYTSSARRKGPQSASSSRYHSRYSNEQPDGEDVLILEDLRRQIDETKRQLDRMPAPKYNSKATTSTKYSLEELKEKIRRAQDDLNQASLHNPAFQKYTQNSETLLELLETEKSLQDEIQYLCNRDIPMLARQLRGAAAELRDTKVRYSRKNDGTQDFMAFIQPTGPGGSITEGDRVRAKAKAMMAARKSGNTGNSTDAAYGLRRAEEEKEEADKKADSIEREMERSRTALLDMRGDLKYLEEMTAVQDLEDKKRFENNPQELSYELRRFIEQLNSKASEPSPYTSSPRAAGGYQSPSSGYQSPAAISSPSVTASPKPKIAAARPRTADEIKKEAERRVQERLAALQAKRNPGSPRSVPTSKPSTPPVSKPDEAEVAAQQRLREAEREAQEMLRQSVSQREETDRKNREAELERLREAERSERQRLEDLEKENAERERQEEEQRKLDDEREEREFQERRRQKLAKEEADRQARFDAIRRDEEEAEQKKQEHKPEEAPVATPPVAAEIPPPAPPAPTPPAPAASIPTPPAPAPPAAATGSSNNPFAKLQNTGSSQAEKPNEAANKRVSYNPFAAFSAFSATKGGAKDDSDSEEDDGWGNDDSDDENEFPAAGSAKNLAGKLFSAMSKRENSGSLETVRESPKPNQSDVPAPPPPPPAAAGDGIPPPPPAPAAPAAPPAPAVPAAPVAAPSVPQPSGGGGDMRIALLSQIQLGTKLKKTVTNDRSASAIAGHVVDDGSAAPVQPVPAPEIAAPSPISAPLSSGGFLAELQARTNGSSPEAPAPAAPAPAEPEPESALPKHDESLPEHEYIALWDYPGSGADDLVFSQDDIILVRDNNDSEDWWYGTLEKSGKTGYFPRNYVQVKPEAVPELNIKAKALYDFDGPEGQGCLSVKMGESVTVIVKENDDWWMAKSEQGQTGLVPANYLEEV